LFGDLGVDRMSLIQGITVARVRSESLIRGFVQLGYTEMIDKQLKGVRGLRLSWLIGKWECKWRNGMSRFQHPVLGWHGLLGYASCHTKVPETARKLSCWAYIPQVLGKLQEPNCSGDMQDSLNHSSGVDLFLWVESYPPQLVWLVDKMMWTRTINNALWTNIYLIPAPLQTDSPALAVPHAFLPPSIYSQSHPLALNSYG
jgi:hypothetical protein